MYTSTAVTDELLALSDELASLGGGDTSIGECAVYFRPRPANPGEGVCVSTEESAVLVRDPRCPADTPAQQAVRRFRVSAGAALGADASQAELADSLGAHASTGCCAASTRR